MADVSKLVHELSGLTLLEAAELARLLKERWRPPKVSFADIKTRSSGLSRQRHQSVAIPPGAAG
jgi:Ribosomal protein L7/L12 dimerisation domain